jgi:phosphonopyruvate decarboxylase
MIKADDFVEALLKSDLGPFIEVPCTILKPVINYILEKGLPLKTPASEAAAMGLAAGYYLATEKIPVVMMQNSGLCNALNAITSLHGIYEIPCLLIITWRGEPGIKDAPEHRIMGAKLQTLLDALDLPYRVITAEGYRDEINEIVRKAKEIKKPVALILRRGLIEEYKRAMAGEDYPLSVNDAIGIIKEKLGEKSVYVSTTGFISRISFNLRDNRDFYMLGSMGHALPLGIAVAASTQRKVVVLDGDGSCLMHAEAMASVGAEKPRNLIHIVLDNGAYASTGDQPSLSSSVDFLMIARGFGYEKVMAAKTREELWNALDEVLKENGPAFIHVKINRSLPPKEKMERVSDFYTCVEIKNRFIENLRS